MTEVYCVKCKGKVEADLHGITMRNGKPALQGKCPVCGTTVTKISGVAKAAV